MQNLPATSSEPMLVTPPPEGFLAQGETFANTESTEAGDPGDGRGRGRRRRRGRRGRRGGQTRDNATEDSGTTGEDSGDAGVEDEGGDLAKDSAPATPLESMPPLPREFTAISWTGLAAAEPAPAIAQVVVEPVVVEPVVEAVVDPIVEPVVEPVVEAVVDPIVEPIVEAPVSEPAAASDPAPTIATGSATPVTEPSRVVWSSSPSIPSPPRRDDY
jgi:hypothetical protein